MKTRFLWMLILSVMVAACNMPNYPQPPNPSFTPSDAEANSFEQAFQAGVDQVQQSGTFNITVTQQQLSSWIALRAPAYAQQNGYQWPMKDAQVSLTGGKIVIYGIIVQPNVPETAGQITVNPSIDANGQLAVTVESGQFGIAGLPSDVLNNLNTTIRNTIAGQLAQISNKYRLTLLNISEGSLQLAGQVTP
jgi:hypothetical protein